MTKDTGDITILDGNAAAGAFSEVFAMDVTTVGLVCGGCDHEGPVGALHLYGEPVGCVLRCPQCGQVNMRLLRTRSTINLDVRGAAPGDSCRRLGDRLEAPMKTPDVQLNTETTS